MNPYWGANFFEFFIILFKRLTGQLPLNTLPSDEVQLLVLIFIAISTALLGTFLTLRKMTMVANSLSHTTLLGIIVCVILLFPSTSELHLNTPLLMTSSIASAFLTVVVTEATCRLFKLQEDAAIGFVFTTLFALSIVLVTLFTRNSHIGVDVITGNVDGLDSSDMIYTCGIALINSLATLLSFRPWTLSAFDPQFSLSSGMPLQRYHYIQMALTALTFVTSLRAVGVVLVLAFLVGPTLIARRWVSRLKPLLFASIATSIGFSLFGVALSRCLLSTLHIALSTGGLIVTLLSFGYFINVFVTKTWKSSSV